MSSDEPSKLTRGEVKTLIATIMNETDPNAICAFVIISVSHPSHIMSVAHSEMPESAAARIALRAATDLAEVAVERGEMQMYPVIAVQRDGEFSHFASIGITHREAIALEEENTGYIDGRLEAITDRFMEAEYRRAMERKEDGAEGN